mmetsp:Transcript_22882/g.52425  ORF Transcript_22882/g.52425 Transcript_22882/m.52425 type:complete len:225 (-) Transcript_22882:211-885(-)|eukprot:CAMPEP_0113300494 /NCGR_PEP_ID=MMETSP0010_2-20120614/2101_1 /TAXON_ID=216773 ORGANISM="Corethron hystrix, Strain 308" /NCGR_SAMPLE_ID=MMETSP0010_2 /ASSEMBLY_ACC=CAM_ASM_000155 /LENGTH=224 /DNA_ID=CAMNT_0000153929 /DNA_START=48 /DNA_END=722 /DNA_ORIENTATION=+ /assembly_acc=CAM_ASM_000155
MSCSIGDWDNDFTRASKTCNQIRSKSLPPSQGAQALANLVSTVERLEMRLKQMEEDLSSQGGFGSTGFNNISRPELARRRSLMDSLKVQVESLLGPAGIGAAASQNLFSTSNSSSQKCSNPALGGAQQQQLQSSSLAMQEDMLNELAAGVGRLKNQSQMIGEESRMHVRLLNEMDVDVDRATVGFEDEAKHAEQARQQTSVKKLYSIIAGLSILLLFLLSVGFS